MDNMILGLLFLCRRTIYQLRGRIDEGLNLMYSSSMGSIQAAIKKLLCCGYIQAEEVVEQGKGKKYYSITESGKRHFLQWVNEPIEGQSLRCPELVKVYFMGFSQKENREASIKNYLSVLKERHTVLSGICEAAQSLEIPESGRDIFTYQQISALYGRDLYAFTIDWFTRLLEKMRGDVNGKNSQTEPQKSEGKESGHGDERT